MSASAWRNEYRTTTVCIDSYEDGVPVGRFYNSYNGEGSCFRSMTQFLIKMEQAMDDTDFPKAYTETRTFAPPTAVPQSTPPSESKSGKAATFTLRILFRQNSSWQGSVAWLEGRQEQSFRSVLELMLLMDNALSYARTSDRTR